MIQKATLAQLPEILKLYAQARMFMAQNGNPDQWGNAYPPQEMIRADIENGKSYVNLENGHIRAVFYFAVEEDPTYSYIEGAWLNDAPYGVIHRIAVGEAEKVWRRSASGLLMSVAATCALIPTKKISPCSGAWPKTALPAAASSIWRTAIPASPIRRSKLWSENLFTIPFSLPGCPSLR